MRLLLPVLVAIVLSFPSPGGAGTLTFEIGGDLAVDFGKVPVEISSDADGDVGYGSFEFVSGPYLGGQYFYGAGTLTMELTVFNPDGDDFEGTFTAPVLPFWIDVTELRECEDEEEADDCEDPDFPGSKADFWLDLGAGLFDSRTAKTLGIRPETLGGAMFLGLEGIDGGPASVRRRGADYRGFTYLDIFTEAAPVPEPGLLFLGAVAAGGWMARRRRPDR